MSSIIQASRSLALRQVVAKVFGHVDPALPQLRSGRKFIKPLKGPELLSYYPPPFNILEFIEKNPGAEMPPTTAKEDYRLMINESRKSRGKSPPKKGKGKRATLKKK